MKAGAGDRVLLGARGLVIGARRYSEHTARAIDEAVKEIVATAFERALHLLRAHRDTLERAANLLLERETLAEAELASIVAQFAPAARQAALPQP